MAKPEIQLVTTDGTFQSWLDRTNELVNILQNEIITASVLGDTTGTSGAPMNATLIGDFTASTVIADDILQTNTLQPKTGSSSINLEGQLSIISSPQNAVTFTSNSGARTTYASSSLSWTVGFQNTTTNSFIINNGTGSLKFALTTDGNLSVPGTISASEVLANAQTATKLLEPVRINGVDFDGSQDITVPAGAILTRGSYLLGNNFDGSANATWAVDATAVNTAGKVVARDASGNFAANQITASSFIGTADQAKELLTARKINGVDFDGTIDVNIPSNLSTNNSNQSGFLLFSLGETGNQSAYTKSNIRANPFTSTISAVNFNSSSDETLKENIVPISNALEKVQQISGVHFNWKDNGEKSIGVIAQEIEKVFPELVQEIDDRKTVSYGNLIAVLIEAIKELDDRTKNFRP